MYDDIRYALIQAAHASEDDRYNTYNVWQIGKGASAKYIVDFAGVKIPKRAKMIYGYRDWSSDGVATPGCGTVGCIGHEDYDGRKGRICDDCWWEWADNEVEFAIPQYEEEKAFNAALEKQEKERNEFLNEQHKREVEQENAEFLARYEKQEQGGVK